MWFLDLITGGIIPEDGETLPGAALSDTTRESLVERTVMLYGERMTLTALADVSGRNVPTLLRRIDGLGMSVEQAAFGEGDVVDDLAPSDFAKTVAVEIKKIMAMRKVKPKALAKGTEVPSGILVRVLDGTLPILPEPFLAICAHLGVVPRLMLQMKKQ
jgi:hypothetical protein